jgi:hypothetical protein
VRNEAVAGDGLRGPTLEGAAELAVLLALIDDHGRLLVGWRWGTGEDMIGLEAPGIDGSWRARGDPRGSPSGLGRQVTSARQQGRAHPSNLTMRSSPFAELTAVRDYRTHLQTVLKRSPPVAAVRARERALVEVRDGEPRQVLADFRGVRAPRLIGQRR